MRHPSDSRRIPSPRCRPPARVLGLGQLPPVCVRQYRFSLPYGRSPFGLGVRQLSTDMENSLAPNSNPPTVLTSGASSRYLTLLSLPPPFLNSDPFADSGLGNAVPAAGLQLGHVAVYDRVYALGLDGGTAATAGAFGDAPSVL